MNLTLALFGILVLLLVQKILGGEETTYRDRIDAPLALTQIGNSPELNLAIPQRISLRTDIVKYNYDDHDEQGLIQEFKTACPAYTNQQKKEEDKWTKKANITKSGSLFFLEEYTGWRMTCQFSRFQSQPDPSIRKTDEECGKSQGDIYEVGYPVLLSNGEEKIVKFMAIYEVCYSKVKSIEGVIFTRHRIDSPSLMLLKTRGNYEPRPWNSFSSSLDPKWLKVQSLYKRKHLYQFVPRYDMPTVLWQFTTLFPFNYIFTVRISDKYNLFKGMLKYDNIIQLVSKQNNKKFTFYTGPHQTTIHEKVTHGQRRKKQNPVKINSVWKVIIDEEKNATILVTQLTKRICDETENYKLCDQDFRMLEKYDGGGCTYKCSVDTKVLDSLPLPKLDIKGKLDLSYTEPVEQKSEEIPNGGGEQEGMFGAKNAISSPKLIDISDFQTGVGFLAALESVDPITAKALKPKELRIIKSDDDCEDGFTFDGRICFKGSRYGSW